MTRVDMEISKKRKAARLNSQGLVTRGCEFQLSQSLTYILLIWRVLLVNYA